MFEFCFHCGGSIDQEQVAGKRLICRHCGKAVGVVAAPAPTVVVDQALELVRSGTAERCALCGQLVAVKVRDGARSLVPHRAAGKRAICPSSGKPIEADRKDGMTREVIRVVACQHGAHASIEELTLEYLHPTDRVRMHIAAIRDLLGPAFRMADYPAALGRPGFAVWTSVSACVVGKHHPNGGLQTLTDAEIVVIVDDLDRSHAEFFA